MMDGPVILFDGICNLCNSCVNAVIRRDPQKIFRFASQQSETGKRLLRQFNLLENDINSFILIENDQVFTRSAAALRVAKKLHGPAKLLYGFIIVPGFIRDAVYNWIAHNRYRWFGKRESCMIPEPSVISRFIN
jgi:predicted DCC family thiol-disulfide oxidoreductase YuxK